MPSDRSISYSNDFRALALGTRECAASPVTQRHAAFALALVLAASCATSPATGASETAAASIDVRDEHGKEGTLAGMKGRVVVVDLCSSAVAACNVNARILDEALGAFKGEPVELLTVLIDDDDAMGKAAVRGYHDVLGVRHAVLFAGSRVRAGTSALKDATYVPRLVILDVHGAVRVDDSGGVVNLQGLVNRVQPLVDEANGGHGVVVP